MWSKRLFKTGYMLLFLMAVFNLFSLKAVMVKAKTVAEHEVFSDKTVKKRISEIDNNLLKSSKKPTVKKARFVSWMFAGEKADFTYYIDGKKLMFAMGKDEKSEYSLYFHKNQLIQLSINKKGEKGKTYTQLYKKLDKSGYDEMINLYMELEDFSIIRLDDVVSKSDKMTSGERIFVTGISDKSLTYHIGHGCGTDNSVRSLYPEAYKVKMTKSVKIKDYTENPTKYIARSVKWLKEKIGDYLYVCELVEKNGKLVEIKIPFES